MWQVQAAEKSTGEQSTPGMGFTSYRKALPNFFQANPHCIDLPTLYFFCEGLCRNELLRNHN
jgi:hypothetical protein